VPDQLAVDETTARQVILVQAIEVADAQGALVSEVEREHAERAVLERRGVAHAMAPDPAWYLPMRARELLAIAEKRQPSLARLELRDPWWDRAAIVLPVLAFIAGFGTERLGNPHQMDLLSVPLLGFVLWNVAVYVLLLVSLARPGRRLADRPLRWMADLPAWFSERTAARLRRSALAQFRLAWWRVAGPLESARVRRVLHLCAAAWALGLAAAIVVLGLGREFRIGWESTFLQPQHVHAIVNAISWPGRIVAGIEPYSLEEILQLHRFRSSGQVAAQRWAWLYIAFVLLVVFVPRALLAMASAWRARRLARAVRLPLDDEYFAHVMARVSPLRLGVALVADEGPLREMVLCILRQAGDPDVPDALGPVTSQGDSLVLGQAADAVQAWIALADEGALRRWLADAPAPSLPTLLLCGPAIDCDDARRQAAARGIDAVAVPLAQAAACWALEAPLRQAVQGSLPLWQRAGAERLMQAWARNHRRRRDLAMRRIASALAESACDVDKVKSHWPGAKGRDTAMAALLERLQGRLDRVHDDLLRIHAVQAFLSARSVTHAEHGLSALVNPGSAGAAGVLAGALAGAKVDLITGGITMGAGAALGALLGGAGAFSAARWWDLGGSVRLSDEQLQSLAESLLVQYLAVIHAGRLLGAELPWPAAWRTEAIAALALESKDLAAAWKAVRVSAGDEAAVESVTQALARATLRVLESLYGKGSVAILDM
jgi:hypothetical protein